MILDPMRLSFEATPHRDQTPFTDPTATHDFGSRRPHMKPAPRSPGHDRPVIGARRWQPHPVHRIGGPS